MDVTDWMKLLCVGYTIVYDLKDNNITEYKISPEKLGFKLADINDLKGGDPKMNAQIIIDLLKGKKSPALI